MMSGKDIFSTSRQVDTFIGISSPKSRNRISSTWWVWEILSMSMSWACTACLVYILNRHHKTSLASWPWPISINATVALLVTIAKATLLVAVSACLGQAKWAYLKKQSRNLNHLEVIDGASRGTWGSLQTLSQISWGLATIGAIIVLLALPIDFFAQQVVRLEQILNEVNITGSSATFGYTQSYDTGTTNRDRQSGDPFAFDDSTVDSAMQGAVLRGIYQNTWSPLFKCTTNCTWQDTYTSLGFDSSCSDVTAETLSTQICVKSGSNATCNFKTPGNISLTTQAIRTVWSTIAIVNSSSLLGEAGSLVNTGTKVDYQSSIPSGLVRTAIWTNISKTVQGYDNDSQEHQDRIFECTLSLVAWRWSNISSISNSFFIGLKERIPLNKGIRLPAIPGSGGPPIVDRYWFNESSSGQHSSNYSQSSFNQSSVPSLYVLSSDIGALVSFITSPAISGKMLNGESLPTYTQGVTGAFTNQNATAIFTNVAESMTEYLQQTRTRVLAHGTTSEAIVIIRVRWIWMALPLLVEVAGAVLLAGTILSSRRSKQVPLWKSSPTALLFHGVFPDGLMSSDLKGPEELNRRVQSLKVRLE
ncbi:hypothetical protein VTL71DRAFT_5498 [Oculimacula yallundae]|uniref:Uncharacterized protein n=1 Tax=Oculimacula yallundae TaxID=86028 RepID=A0ABR4C197_9HELO